ncbi:MULTISPECIES: lysine biosynthesis protein LysW [Micromonospora]|uniref:Lysine biosynthesis protein LysW n=1 Tax=Micromonospora robiginosa TaxID=2749844 RepID=A0A7L6B3X7_9ACTN|nr:lysine biosynthesis protein LysW [Micromonospora ferruginea]QLQ36662.1 lysine biosynthesis protein LysW [Micromonospora ferruginea]
MSTVACPDCEARVSLDTPVLNEIVECAECRSELEVLSTDPVVLGRAPEVEEDWGE